MVTIRPCKTPDLQTVYAFICDLEDEKLDLSVFQEIFYGNLLNPTILYLLAEENGTPQGFISVHLQQLLHHNGTVAEIQEFYVSPQARGNGIGRKLLNEAVQILSKQPIKSIEVTTNRRRIENTTIYERLGFVLTHNKFTLPH